MNEGKRINRETRSRKAGSKIKEKKRMKCIEQRKEMEREAINQNLEFGNPPKEVSLLSI